jgi:lysophospholipase L1-like esterase
VKRLAAALLATLLGLAMLEGALRVVTVLPPAPLFVDIGSGRVAVSPDWPVIGKVQLREVPTRLRIVWMGASTVQGVPYQPVSSPPRWLDLILAWRGVRAEVVPIAGSGLDITRITRLMGDVLELQPDVIVLTTGHNEYLRTGQLLGGRWWYSLQLGWRLNLLIEGAALQVGRIPTLEHGFDHDAILANLRTQLAEMNRMAEEAGVILVMTVPICNLSEFPPALGDNPGLSPAPDQAWALGQDALGLGNRRAAREAFEYARDNDRWPHRATDRIIAAVKDAARVLVPLDRIFEQASRNGSPGFELFMDHCHPNLPGQRLMATAVADVLEDLGLSEASGLRGQAPTIDYVLPRLGVSAAVQQAAEARTGRALVRFALLSGRHSSLTDAARDILVAVQAGAATPIGEIETNLLLLELKMGKLAAARGRLAATMRNSPRSVTRLQHLYDTYPWVREVFEDNSVRLSGGELLPLRRLP